MSALPERLTVALTENNRERFKRFVCEGEPSMLLKPGQ